MHTYISLSLHIYIYIYILKGDSNSKSIDVLDYTCLPKASQTEP